MLFQGLGFISLSQTLINIGAQFGRVNAVDLLPDPSTVKQRIKELADAERAVLYPRIIAAAVAEELACTLDMWTEDSRKISLMSCNVVFTTLNKETNQWELETKVFFTEQFPVGKQKTAENLREFVVENFVARGVPRDKVEKVWFVTGN